MNETVEHSRSKLKGARRVIARRMHESLMNTAQLTLHSKLNIDALAKFKEEHEVSYTDLFVKSVALTLQSHRNLNASLIDNEFIQWKSINIGMAVTSDDILFVPNIFDADEKSFAELKENRQRLMAEVKAKTITPEDMNSGTFTISNLGLYPIDDFTPIINPPQVAILGIGRINREAIVEGDEIVIGKMVPLSLTINHQVVDGEPGAKFLARLDEILNNPDIYLKNSL